ncbi:MAG: hypothetical protein H8E13_23185 [Actinobacteria bacterium]|nr:hypothetical protein [Actinomycetota bacterium]
MKKTIFVSEFTPPVLEGIAIMLYNLFTFFPPGSVCMLTDDPAKRKSKKDEKLRLPFKHYIVRVPNFAFWFIRSSNVRSFLQYCWLPFILFKAFTIMLNEKIDNIFSLNTRGPYLVSAYFLHKITGKTLFVYMFDLWSKNPMNQVQEKIALIFEKRILRASKTVFVMSERLSDYYKKNYSVKSVVIHHSYIKEEVRKAELAVSLKDSKKYFDIVFTGVMNTDTLWLPIFREILRDLSSERIRLRLCVPCKDDVSINDKNIIVESLNREDVLLVQKKADILFLPMVWSKYHPREIAQTASPSKLGEYLISGVPILVLAPKDSYISEYATRDGWALVVNNLNEETLKNAILKLKNDSELRKSRVSNALKVAINHDAEIQSAKVQKYLLN